MVDRDVRTLVPPPPSDKPDHDAQHKQLIQLLADHPDPHMRILAHISSRQFELSERISDLTKMFHEKTDALTTQLGQHSRDVVDQFNEVKKHLSALDDGFVEIEDRTSELEKNRTYTNGSSYPVEQ